MYDLVIFSDLWPKGMFLAQKCLQDNKRVLYVNLKPESLLAPFGVFLESHQQEQKYLLESLGFLHRQKEGFCVMTPETIFSFQETARKDLLNFDKETSFSSQWLGLLSKNLSSEIFDNNDDDFSEEQMNFYSDYFIFEACANKKENFQKQYPNLEIISASVEDLQYSKKNQAFTIKGQSIQSSKFLWMAQKADLMKACSQKTIEPDWKWHSILFKSNPHSYDTIIPRHFISLKNLSLPWSYDNLLSVFHSKNYWNVWFRLNYHGEPKDMINPILSHLDDLFKSRISFHYGNDYNKDSFRVYPSGILKSKFKTPKNLMTFSETHWNQDLGTQIQLETQMMESLT